MFTPHTLLRREMHDIRMAHASLWSLDQPRTTSTVERSTPLSPVKTSLLHARLPRYWALKFH